MKEEQQQRSSQRSIEIHRMSRKSFVMDHANLKFDLNKSKRKASVLNKLHHAASVKMPSRLSKHQGGIFKFDSSALDKPNPFFEQAVSEGAEQSESLSSLITETDQDMMDDSEVDNKSKSKLDKDLANLEHFLHHMPLDYETLSNPPECLAKNDLLQAVPERSLKN